LGTGFNNASYAIETETASYVAKVYLDARSAPDLAFEHDLLMALADHEMPFSVPTLVPTHSDEVLARASDVEYMILMDRIPGIPAGRGDAALTEKCGRTLALLNLWMRRADLPPGSEPPITFESLSAVSPALPDPIQAVQALFPAPKLSLSICEALTQAEEDWLAATAGVPRQIIHADYFPPNVLHLNGEISGVIDFEFAGVGHPAMDFAIGLIAFGSKRGTFTPFPRLFDAFAKGYLHVAPFGESELRAVPALLLMREAHSFIHWFGRLASDRISREEVIERGQRLLSIQSWLDAEGDDLVGRLQEIQAQ
jgi:homoserine kinase type II